MKIKLAEIWAFVMKIYDKNLMHYAASLSFHTLLSIIPVLFITLSIFTKMPSFEKYYGKIKEFIFSSLLPSNQAMITSYVEQFLQNSLGLGVLGFLAVIFTSMMFFGDYEYVINRIMDTKPRGFWRNLSLYWTLLTLAPLGLGASFYLSGVIQEAINSLTTAINFLAIFPYIIIWSIFAITFVISINKEMSAKSILISSFIASFAWNISKVFFVEYARYSTTYLSIYGSFSVLLFFFVWIYLSWIIFLHGVKMCKILDDFYQCEKR